MVDAYKGRRGKRVLVVGAGIAGLAAAYELARAGYDITVLEADTRPGGRIRTLKTPFADGMYADAGASFFADSDPYVSSYARLFDVPLMVDAVRGDNKNYFIGGRWIGFDQGPLQIDGLTAKERAGGAAFIFFEYLVKGLLEPAKHPLQSGWPPENLRRFDKMTAERFLEERGASKAAIRFLSLGVLGANGEGIHSYSALALLAIVSLACLAQNSFWIIGGTERLPRAFASRLSDRIRYGIRVTAAEATVDGVRLFAEGPHRRSIEYNGLYAVFALPTSALKAIAFSPKLPPQKAEFITKLQRVSVTRVFLQMRRRFWEDEAPDGVVLSDSPPALLISGFPLHHTRRGILELYATAQEARDLAKMEPQDRIHRAMDRVQQIFPEGPRYFEGGTSFSWDRDPSARGAAAFFAPNQMLDAVEHIARPEPPFFFAGDETTVLPGWSQGALFSGRRAAEAIQKADE